ncbi:MAG: hypothetical protein M1483_08295 [Actinobacteria bacterium]|nr:hypothetical protein [Actinomycetota bacterium]MCL6105605.1 hypothetical protein [Actinomycetota bacterium]
MSLQPYTTQQSKKHDWGGLVVIALTVAMLVAIVVGLTVFHNNPHHSMGNTGGNVYRTPLHEPTPGSPNTGI